MSKKKYIHYSNDSKYTTIEYFLFIFTSAPLALCLHLELSIYTMSTWWLRCDMAFIKPMQNQYYLLTWRFQLVIWRPNLDIIEHVTSKI